MDAATDGAERPRFARYRDTVVERVGDRWIDPFVMAMAVHHAGGDTKALRDIVEFCLHPVHVEQLDILLRNVGIRAPLMAQEAVTTDQWEGGRILTATMRFGEDGRVDWNRGYVTVHGSTIPETVANDLVGRNLADLVDHPYVPRGLAIAEVAHRTFDVIVGIRPEALIHPATGIEGKAA